MTDTKYNFDNIFTKMKNACNICCKSFLCPWTRKGFSLIMNGILKMSWFVHIFLQNKHMVPIVYALLRSYLDFYG